MSDVNDNPFISMNSWLSVVRSRSVIKMLLQCDAGPPLLMRAYGLPSLQSVLHWQRSDLLPS